MYADIIFDGPVEEVVFLEYHSYLPPEPVGISQGYIITVNEYLAAFRYIQTLDILLKVLLPEPLRPTIPITLPVGWQS